MKNKIRQIIEESRGVKDRLLTDDSIGIIEKITGAIVNSLNAGGKVIIFGNGGSAADSQHMAAELVGRFKKERKPLPAISLTTNTSTITALSNDYSYGVSFKRQLLGLGKKGDIVVGISTSGNAENVIEALKAAKEEGLVSIALTGKGGGSAKDIADMALIVNSDNTPRIQEAHILIIHILCELVEDRF